MEKNIRINYDINKPIEEYISTYKELGYKLDCVCNHSDGDFLEFGPLTDYHSIVDNKWVFDKEVWIEREVRPQRNKKLADSDFSMMYDVRKKLTAVEITKWETYRQELRDFTNNLEFSDNLAWPENEAKKL